MSYELSAHVRQELEEWKTRFPADRQRSAVLRALHLVQHENQGYVTADHMNAVAEFLELPTIQVYEVGTFYSMFQTKKCGRNEVSICTNVSCMLRGADDIVEHVENKLGIRLGESTEDGRVFLKKEEECIAACCGAPAMQVNHRYYENLDTRTIDEILDGLD